MLILTKIHKNISLWFIGRLITVFNKIIIVLLVIIMVASGVSAGDQVALRDPSVKE